MVRLVSERILVIGDAGREVQAALAQAAPSAQVTSVATVFDGISELAAGQYTTVLAAAEPIERRPEAAVRALRSVAGDSRLVLFGHPTFELLSRKMMQFGCDEYVVSPPNSEDLQKMLSAPPSRASSAEAGSDPSHEPESAAAGSAALRNLSRLPFSDLLLESLLQHPHDAPAAAVRQISASIAPALELRYTEKTAPPPTPDEGKAVLSHVVQAEEGDAGALHLLMPADEPEAPARQILSQLAHLVGKVATLQDRHNRLQKLAITDELTGLYNARYFRHFLTRIIERAKKLRFPVTLLLFDIDDFKKYNDLYGHCVGDEILRQTAGLMRRCCRDHDLVARIGGDEFAVVFWDKEGPRQPYEAKHGVPLRPPQTPLQIFERFKRLIQGEDFSGLGSSGRGHLGISAGLAVYPYDAPDAASLIKAADEFLMFGAKQGGKNSIFLVDGENGPPA